MCFDYIQMYWKQHISAAVKSKKILATVDIGLFGKFSREFTRLSGHGSYLISLEIHQETVINCPDKKKISKIV